MKSKSKEEKELIFNLYQAFSKEKKLIEAQLKAGVVKASQIPILYSNVAKRTANALKVSEFSYNLKFGDPKLSDTTLNHNFFKGGKKNGPENLQGSKRRRNPF